MKLFELRCETDTSVVGAYPQVAHYEIRGHEPPYDSLWRTRSPGAEQLQLRGHVAVDAIPTHVMSCSELSPGRGLVIDDRVLPVFAPCSARTTAHPFSAEDPKPRGSGNPRGRDAVARYLIFGVANRD